MFQPGIKQKAHRYYWRPIYKHQSGHHKVAAFLFYRDTVLTLHFSIAAKAVLGVIAGVY